MDLGKMCSWRRVAACKYRLDSFDICGANGEAAARPFLLIAFSVSPSRSHGFHFPAVLISQGPQMLTSLKSTCRTLPDFAATASMFICATCPCPLGYRP